MKIQSHPLSGCRACGAKDPFKFLTLARMPLPDGHTRLGEDAFATDLSVFWCPECWLVQTQHDLDLSEYYADYSYTTSHSPSVKTYQEEIAEKIWEKFGLVPGDTVVEVGSGKGGQLKEFKTRGAKVLGYEPSKQLAEHAQDHGIETHAEMFTPNTVIPESHPPIRVFLMQFTFDHVADPVSLLKALRPFMDEEKGIIVVETHNFLDIVDRCEACLFTHEHTIYPTTETMGRIFAEAGFRLVSTDLIPDGLQRANSLISVGTPTDSQIPSQNIFRKPSLAALEHKDAYVAFAGRVHSTYTRFADRIRVLRSQGKKVAGYGAAGRGVNTIAIAGLGDEDLICVYDANPELHGLRIPGTRIPVHSPDQVFEDKADEIIVFSFGYMTEIEKRLEPYLKERGNLTSMLDFLVNEIN